MISIKRLGDSDVELAMALVDAWRSNSDTGQLTPEEILERLSDDNFYALVAIEDKEVVGGLTAYRLPLLTRAATKMLLYEIEVHKEYRSRGIGTKLIRSLKTYCRSEEIESIFLIADQDNEPAAVLYEKNGGSVEVASMYHFGLVRAGD